MHMAKLIDLTGQRFGRLVVLERVTHAKGERVRWWCKCDCGRVTIALSETLRNGDSKSCGCLQKEIVSRCNTKHKKCDEKLYGIWNDIKQRTGNKNNPRYADYGARGITVCAEWQENFLAFRAWALTHGYQEGLSIDRIDNDKGYSPDNCRWATDIQQANNKRNNHVVTYQGKSFTLAEWAKELNISYTALKQRINKLGWSIEQALTTPVRKK